MLGRRVSDPPPLELIMSVLQAPRLLATVVGGAVLSLSALVPVPASASPTPFTEAGSAAVTTTAASEARVARSSAAFRITVRGWTRTIRRGDQATIDHCRAATLWQGPLPGGPGTTWLAGHNHCGFYRWDRMLGVGDRFTVTTPDGRKLRYRVTGRGYVGRHSGTSAGLIHGDITLQTCRGSGTAFTYARLLGS
jgi:hypothetical protein